MARLTLPTPVEQHAGVWVKRDDCISDDMPAGKLRGVLPLFLRLHADGARGIVNAAASHSNSHAVCAYAGAQVGLHVRTVANTHRLLPNLEAAGQWGAEVVLEGPMHLGPLRARAGRLVGPAEALLPWAFADPLVVSGIADAVAETVPYDAHVVPVGAGPYVAGVISGLLAAGRLGREQVWAVCGLGLRPTTATRIAYLSGFALGLPEAVHLVGGDAPQPTPWPSDPHYEWPAWPLAQRLAADGQRVLFWSVGRPIGGAK